MMRKLLVLLMLVGCSESETLSCPEARKKVSDLEHFITNIKIFDQSIIGKCYITNYREDNYALKITKIADSSNYAASNFRHVQDLNGKYFTFLSSGAHWSPGEFYLLKEVSCEYAIEFTKKHLKE